MSFLRQLALGFAFIQKCRLLQNSEYFDEQMLREMQIQKLRAILLAAADIPYYSGNIPQCNTALTDPLKVLQALPMIDKGIIRSRINDFLNGPMYRRLRANSGGSTGTPFLFYMDRFVTRQVEKAFIFDQWSRVGYRFGDSIFNLRGRVPDNGRFLHHDRLFNIYFASSFDLNSRTVSKYVDTLNTLRPKFLHGYPSTMYQLSVLMSASGKRLNFQPMAVFCGSEKLFSYQRQKIESIFGCRVYHWYGHSECLALGGECEYSTTLHFYPQYGYTELIPSGVFDDNGNELYEIVATGFNNPVMPLIRYRTGDYAIPSKDQKCRCGRNYLLIDEIIGRQQEFIVDKNEDLISATSFIFGQHYSAFSGISNIKIFQDKPGYIDIIIVKGSEFSNEDYSIMQCRMFDLLGDRIKMSFKFSDNIEKTAIGKAKLVDQQLNIQRYLQQ